MQRVIQFSFIAVMVCLSWLLMQAVHEAGHVLHAWLSGGKVFQVILTPLQISRTDYSYDPYPQFVVWGGPLWGCVIPLALACAAQWRRRSCAPLFRFFAGFCFIANGVYLGSAPLCAVGDAQELLDYGVSVWILAAAGLPVVGAGLYAWNGLGPYFGLGSSKGSVDRRAVIGVAVTLAIVVAVELAFAR